MHNNSARLLLSLFSLLLYTVGAAGEEKPGADVGYLYVLEINEGRLEGEQLILQAQNRVTYFSERPERIAGNVSLQDLVGLWGKGKNSFASNPPNAVLSIKGTDAVLELKQAELAGNILTFNVSVLKGSLPPTFKHTVLTIDAGPVAAPVSTYNEYAVDDDGWDGAPITVKYGGRTVVDYVIPVDTPYKTIYLTLKGGDGGVRSNWTGEGKAGVGATIEAAFSIGKSNELSRLIPGSTLRFIIGEKGDGATANIGISGSGGGGGTAVFYKTRDRWFLLAVAGGGGGAYGTGVGDFGDAHGGQTSEEGGNGRGNKPGKGGPTGQGGASSLVGGGGGGAFSPGLGLGKLSNGTLSQSGGAGWVDICAERPASGRCNDDDPDFDSAAKEYIERGSGEGPKGGRQGSGGGFRSGGWGIGGGGAGAAPTGGGSAAGGGGGGFSGGGYGGTANGGGGGGSYIRSDALVEKKSSGGLTMSPQHGEATFQGRISVEGGISVDNENYIVDEATLNGWPATVEQGGNIRLLAEDVKYLDPENIFYTEIQQDPELQRCIEREMIIEELNFSLDDDDNLANVDVSGKYFPNGELTFDVKIENDELVFSNFGCRYHNGSTTPITKKLKDVTGTFDPHSHQITITDIQHGAAAFVLEVPH